MATLRSRSGVASAALLLATSLGATALAATAGATPAGRPPLVDSKPKSKARSGMGGVGMVLDGSAGKVVVSRVVPGGPAARAGVRAGDVVLRIDGQPAGNVSSKAAGRVRGAVGTRVQLTLDRGGTAVEATITRADLSRLFPKRAGKVLAVEAGLSLLATSGRWSLGLTFPRGGQRGELLRYQWVIAPAGRKLSDAAAQRGLGAVAWTRAGATIQIADWRVDLAPWPGRGKLVIARSNLPVAEVAGDAWVETEPMTARYVKPRPAPRAYRTTWPAGPCTLDLHVTLDGAAAAHHRVSLRLADRGGVLRPSATVTTDAEGHATLRLPAGAWRLASLYPALSGGGRDLYYAAQASAQAPWQCRAGQTVKASVAARSPAQAWVRGGKTLPPSALQHSLVGRPLQDVPVLAWLGGRSPLPKTLKGKVMLIYFWATWCGPCKRVSPMIAELAVRMKERGLIVVPASVDRDRTALEDYVAMASPGAAPVAWVGPQALASLPIRGIPTAVVIDDQGMVRAVHTGTGVGVETWEHTLGQLLDEAQGKRKRSPVLPPAKKAAAGAPAAKKAGDKSKGVKKASRKASRRKARRRAKR